MYSKLYDNEYEQIFWVIFTIIVNFCTWMLHWPIRSQDRNCPFMIFQRKISLVVDLMFLYFSPLPPSAPSLLSSILKNSASPLLWRLHPCSEENSPESSGGPFQPMDWTHDPEGTTFTAFVFLRTLLITWNIIGCCCFDMGIFNVHVMTLGTAPCRPGSTGGKNTVGKQRCWWSELWLQSKSTK